MTSLIEQRGKFGMIVSDNGTELTSNAILAWSKDLKVEWHYIAPGKPMQIGYTAYASAIQATQILDWQSDGFARCQLDDRAGSGNLHS